MGILKSERERGFEDGKAEAERREKEGTSLFDLAVDVGQVVGDIVNPEYGEGYKDGFNQSSK